MVRMAIVFFLLLPMSRQEGSLEEDALRERAREALAKSTRFLRSISTNGGYAGIYSADLKKRYGEALYEPARKSEIWVQPQLP